MLKKTLFIFSGYKKKKKKEYSELSLGQDLKTLAVNYFKKIMVLPFQSQYTFSLYLYYAIKTV